MKILHIIFSFNTGGTENMLADILNEQAKTHHVELIIVNNVFNNELVARINKTVTIHCFNRKPGSINPFKIIELNYKVFKIAPTIIHFHNHNAVKLLKYKTKAKTCLTIHDVNIPLINLNKYSNLFAISNAVKLDVLNRGEIKTTLVYNGVDFSAIEARNANSFNEKFKIVQISRLDYEKKGQHVLLKAIAALIHDRGIKNIRLDFIGAGPSFQFLQSLVKELGLCDYVNFLGLKNREFIYQHLKNYDLLVQPSLYEGFGLTVVEAMAAKINVLVSDIDGPMEIINNGQFGYFFKKGDAFDCSAQINMIMSLIKTKQGVDFAELAYSHVKGKFDIKGTVRKYLEKYGE